VLTGVAFDAVPGRVFEDKVGRIMEAMVEGETQAGGTLSDPAARPQPESRRGPRKALFGAPPIPLVQRTRGTVVAPDAGGRMTLRIAPRRCLAIVLAVSLTACGKSEPTTAPAAAPPPAVTVVRVAREDVTPRSTFTGRIQAVDKVELRARVEGFLEKRAVVKAGDLLLVIEKAPYEAAVADAKGAIVSAEGALKLADVEVDRFRELVRKQAAAQNDLDQRLAKQTQARGNLMQTQATLQRAELDLSYTDVTAPVSGRIGQAAFSVGNYVGPSSGPLATIVSQDPTYVVFPVSQRLLLDLRHQQVEKGEDPRAVEVKLRLGDGRMYGHSGRIDFVDVEVNPGTDTVAIRAELPNPDRVLLDGALVTAVIEAATPKQALVVPQQAVQVDQSGPYVLVVDAESKVQVRRIETEPAIDGRVPVKQGVTEGERVIVDGVQKVRPGIVVTAAEAAARPAGDAK
jgi:membrane fusion protein (multidrug efflux system)